MSFTTRQQSLIIGTGAMMAAEATAATITAIEEQPEITAEGFDSLRINYAMRRASLTAENVAALFPIGSQLGGRKWWISRARPQQKAAGFWVVEVDFLGWAAAKPMKVKVGTSATQSSGKDVLAPTGVGGGTATFAQLDSFENTPTIEVSYLYEGGVSGSIAALSGRVSTNQTPPVTVDVSASIWTSLAEFVWHWPQGWVLMGNTQDRLPGTTVALVTDSYQYIRPKSPA